MVAGFLADTVWAWLLEPWLVGWGCTIWAWAELEMQIKFL